MVSSSLPNLTSLNLSHNGFSECRVSEARFFGHFNSSGFVHSGVIPDHRELRIRTVAFLGEFEFEVRAVEEAIGGLLRRNLAGKSNSDLGRVYRGVLRDGRVVGIGGVYSGGEGGGEGGEEGVRGEVRGDSAAEVPERCEGVGVVR
ncbi:hypothetical protein SASPL_144452 [Salvia splendens]|uniref:Uncharacterized protein n=1 Tax=Salvia splendens TaxID=180675 RepID=A0A8X8WFB2_SALSN|nr:hypothetical protein SASPL_144452 [Salvia splendens]